ncbi:MAG TPA: hypothetical protein VJA47_01045 [archaeon]|nr:hypothetical protein [archaeon]
MLQLQMHSPTLNTVLMIEDVLKNADKQLTVAELKRELPRKVMHNTLLQVLDYLQISGKILFTSKGVIWIYEERGKLEELVRKGLEV